MKILVTISLLSSMLFWVVDGEGMVWYAGNHKAHIGKLDPASGKITRFSMADPQARDPHTLVFERNGDIWFTVQHGNFVGKLSTATGENHLIPVPTSKSRPHGIVVDRWNRPEKPTEKLTGKEF